VTVVDTSTGELASITETDARRLTERIRLLTSSVQESVEKLSELISEAQASGAHVALGYRSWTEYVAAEFADSPLRLGRDDRRELVVSLAAQGMSTRAIAPVVGVAHKTVARDLAAPVSDDTPDPEPEVVDAEIVEDDELDPTLTLREPITGMDGKTYTRPEPRSAPIKPKAVPRRALTEQFFDAFYELTKAVERVERLAEDDRFAQNAEQVTAKHRSDLSRSIEALSRVLNRFNT